MVNTLQLIMVIKKNSSQRLNRIKEYAELGYIKPVLDKIYLMAEIVEAHRYVEKGHKKRGVAITVKKNNDPPHEE